MKMAPVNTNKFCILTSFCTLVTNLRNRILEFYEFGWKLNAFIIQIPKKNEIVSKEIFNRITAKPIGHMRL